MAFQFSSPTMESGGDIPRKHTCDGDNLSPPLEWNGVPDETESLALVCEDLDSATIHRVHWIIFNIPPDEPGLQEGIPPLKTLQNNGVQGVNDFGDIGYGGPCPAGGIHRYCFRLFALDHLLELGPDCVLPDLIVAMEGHILAYLDMTVTYGRG